MGNPKRTLATVCLAIIILLAAGCGVVTKEKSKEEVVAGSRKITTATRTVSREELGQMLMAYADWYVIQMSDACERIKSESTDPARRLLAQELRSRSASSVYDIVTNPDPYTQLFDMTAAVTLQSIVQIDEDQAEERFGPEHGRLLINATRRARVAIWEIAGQILSPEQLENLDFMIWEWRRENPTINRVIEVRFDDFAGTRGKSMVRAASASGPFASIDAARKSADELRLLGERTFFYAKRAPLLIAWRTETTIDEILSTGELHNAFQDMDKLANAAESASKTAATMPAAIDDERKFLLQAFDEREGRFRDLLKETRTTLTEADSLTRDGKNVLTELQKTSASLQELVKSVDAFSTRYLPATPPPTPAATQNIAIPVPGATTETQPVQAQALTPPHPFDIREYTQALTELSQAARELNAVVSSSNQLLASKEWTTRIDELNDAADERVRRAAAQSRDLVDNIFHRVYVSLGILFAALALYKFGAIMLAKKVKQRAA